MRILGAIFYYFFGSGRTTNDGTMTFEVTQAVGSGSVVGFEFSFDNAKPRKKKPVVIVPQPVFIVPVRGRGGLTLPAPTAQQATGIANARKIVTYRPIVIAPITGSGSMTLAPARASGTGTYDRRIWDLIDADERMIEEGFFTEAA